MIKNLDNGNNFNKKYSIKIKLNKSSSELFEWKNYKYKGFKVSVDDLKKYEVRILSFYKYKPNIFSGYVDKTIADVKFKFIENKNNLKSQAINLNGYQNLYLRKWNKFDVKINSSNYHCYNKISSTKSIKVIDKIEQKKWYENIFNTSYFSDELSNIKIKNLNFLSDNNYLELDNKLRIISYSSLNEDLSKTKIEFNNKTKRGYILSPRIKDDMIGNLSFEIPEFKKKISWNFKIKTEKMLTNNIDSKLKINIKEEEVIKTTKEFLDLDNYFIYNTNDISKIISKKISYEEIQKMGQRGLNEY